MLFSEWYGAYYNTVAAILTEAVAGPVDDREMRRLVEKHALGESMISIPMALKEERWQLLRPDGTTPLRHAPAMPLTTLQKRWLKAVAEDPRVKLFGDFDWGLEGVEPLFRPGDVIVFDRYLDGDDYESEEYIRNFRLILDALRRKYPLQIRTLNRKGEPVTWRVMPEYLEYSEKDDKFRLITSGHRSCRTINLGRILSCRPYEGTVDPDRSRQKKTGTRRVVFELVDRRNALERVLLHFAHFEKTAERMDETRYRVTVRYHKEDETEVLIRILSFGPMVRVTAPESFVGLIIERLKAQKSCEL